MHLLLLILLASSPSVNYCELCHSDVKVEFHSSVHFNESMTCVDCHGGRADSNQEELAHSGNFQSFKDRKLIPAGCASCHSDGNKMRPYGLPTDQLALYETSEHGKALARGEIQAAVCSDCHGAHKTLPPSDPHSYTHNRNIPETCGHCHSNQSLMSKYKIPEKIVSDYLSGVHGRALVAGNQNAPVCTSCHGTHGVAPPGVGDVSIVCGQCHQTERDQFRRGPHQKAMVESGSLECAACHGNHNISRADHNLWNTACEDCHEITSPEVQRGKKIQTLFLEAEKEIVNAEHVIGEAGKIPLDVSDYQAGLEEAHTYLVEARPVTHSLQLQETEDLTRRARSLAVEIQTEVKGEQKVFQGRKLILILILFFVLLTLVIMYKYRQILESRSGTKSD